MHGVFSNISGNPSNDNYVENITSVTVNNLTPTLAGPTEITVNEGQEFTLPQFGIHLEDFGFDNPLNQTPPPFGDTTP